MDRTIVIPNKSSFKINEVCSITGVKPYVLRFWETEFDQVSPDLSCSGQKLFSYRDIEFIVLIKKLLFEDKKTIEDAKTELILSFNNESDHHKEESESEAYAPLDNDLPPLNSSMIKHDLKFYDIEKLVMAKGKLSSLLGSIDHLKKRNNWG